jgi:hypothetical protein
MKTTIYNQKNEAYPVPPECDMWRKERNCGFTCFLGNQYFQTINDVFTTVAYPFILALSFSISFMSY